MNVFRIKRETKNIKRSDIERGYKACKIDIDSLHKYDTGEKEIPVLNLQMIVNNMSNRKLDSLPIQGS